MTNIDISIQIDEAYTDFIQPEHIEKALHTTLTIVANMAHSSGAAYDSVAIIVTDNEAVRTLNHQYRGLDQPTDVLSFPNELDPDFPEISAHLGDIIIAYPVAQHQAEAGRHTVTEEIMLLTVHGILHLLGLDHDTPSRKKEMWECQRHALERLNLAHVQPTES